MANSSAREDLLCAHSRVPCIALLGLTAFSLLFSGCSKTEPTQPTPAATAGAKPQSDGQDERLPPILKTAWKGDLDEIVKRRVVRVLVPFRRPEFFYLDGQPSGILQEAFQELEKVLNAAHKTTAANR